MIGTRKKHHVHLCARSTCYQLLAYSVTVEQSDERTADLNFPVALRQVFAEAVPASKRG
jgi:hypothetical protein